PRLERMNLAVEVLAAALESQVAVHHPSERSERLRCPADTRRAAYERTDALYVHLGRRALGEVLAKGVVELVDGCVRRPPGASSGAGVSSLDQLPGRGDDVVHAARIGSSKVVAQERIRTARPEQETDTEADREADCDVLDADQPDAPADGLDDVEEHQEDDREARLSGGERDRPRRV